MSGWVLVLFAGLLVAVVLAALALAFLPPRGAHARQLDRGDLRPHELPSRERPAIGSAPARSESLPAEARPATQAPPVFRVRERPAHTFRVKRRTGVEPPPANSGASAAQGSNGQGGPVGGKRLRVNLDAVCRVTGKTVRACKCPNCQQERANFGN